MAAQASTGIQLPDGAMQTVQTYYGETLTSSGDLKTNACACAAAPPPHVRALLRRIPEPVLSRFYGCGSPLPLGCEGLRLLDLGSGSGRCVAVSRSLRFGLATLLRSVRSLQHADTSFPHSDCYVASALVGLSGSVVGVDITASQLAVARAHQEEWAAEIGWNNLRFVEGRIEALSEAGLSDQSFDLVISNCVVNLSPDKRAVMREAWRVLAWGGEFHFSDVYCDRRLPSELRSHPLLLGECLGGALYVEDFKRLCHEVGFADPRVLSSAPITVGDDALAALLGEARFTSITYRLFKLPTGRLETLCEDYGQYAVYKGTVPHSGSAYSLDDHHRLEKGKPFLVCGNTASMLGETWLAKHFEVVGGRSTHYGLFPCGPAPAAGAPAMGGACC